MSTKPKTKKRQAHDGNLSFAGKKQLENERVVT